MGCWADSVPAALTPGQTLWPHFLQRDGLKALAAYEGVSSTPELTPIPLPALLSLPTLPELPSLPRPLNRLCCLVSLDTSGLE